jgi:hypothetical protein
VFVLDSDAVHRPGLIEPQREWLAARIAESGARWKVAVFHEPCITSSFRGGYPWMLWDELNHVDGILCGHDHFYERLDYSEGGPPLFISGAGGAGLYAFGPPHAQSRVRFTGHNGAMRVVADENALICEFRAANSVTGAEDLIERYEIGSPVENDAFDDFSFFGESGLTLRLVTRTPNPEPVPLDPAVRVLGGPHNEMLAESDGGDEDGRNVRLTHRLAATGKFFVRVSPEGSGGGEFAIETRLDHPAGRFGDWRSLHFPANDPAGEALEDPDTDHFANIVEYALGRNPLPTTGSPADSAGVPAIGSRPGFVQLTFDLPAPLPVDVTYVVEASPDLRGEGWVVIATKAPLRPWQGSLPMTTASARPDRQQCTIEVPLSLAGPRYFFRLRVVAVDAE